MEMDSLSNGNAITASPLPNTTPPAAAMTPFSKLTLLTEALKLEHQFLRVSFEHYKMMIRANHRFVEKEVTSVISSVADVTNSDDFSKEDTVNHLTLLVSRLQGLKRKALFEQKQWNFLVDQFKQEFCKIYAMTLEPLLNIYLQVGLSSLNTPYFNPGNFEVRQVAYKSPRWHEHLQCWCFNFHGWVTVASVKNFQLVYQIVQAAQNL